MLCCVGCDVPMWVGIDEGYVVYEEHAIGIVNVGRLRSMRMYMRSLNSVGLWLVM